MKPFCEIVVTSVLPAVRSIMTKELLEKHGLNQKKAAELLGLTQPAISQYKREYRGYKVKMLEKQPEIMEMIDDLTKDIVSGKIDHKQIHTRFCKICENIRKNKIICKLHEQSYPEIAPCQGCPEVC